MKYSPPRIDEVQIPVVGQRYLVPCVLHPKYFDFLPNQWAPVIKADFHQDPELGQDGFHLHYDLRFVPEEKFLYVNGVNVSAILAFGIGLWYHSFEDLDDNYRIAWKSKKCFRLNQVFDANNHHRSENFNKLELINTGKRSDCRTCPHKGANLESYPPDKNGGILCPMHGLTWHYQTGELMKRGVQNADK